MIVVNKKKHDYEVGCTRGAKWGNPYVIGIDGSRKEVIEKFRIYFLNQLELGLITKKELFSLNGMICACVCKPLPCHCDVIKEILENEMRLHKRPTP